ncbi:MAG: integrase arm-type DNA-binding domain-containing protein [Pseudomonadota bacterium]
MAKLTDLKCRRLKRGEKASDGHNLTLWHSKTGSKLWRWRYRLEGRENIYALGKYGEHDDPDARVFTLSGARRERERAAALVKKGLNPSIERKQARHLQAQQRADAAKAAEAIRLDTFEVVALEWLDSPQMRHVTAAYSNQVRRTFKRLLFPAIGNRPISEITSGEMFDALEAVADQGIAATARLLTAWAGQVFAYGIVKRRCDSDPTLPLRGQIRAPRPKHYDPVKPEQFAPLWTQLEGLDTPVGWYGRILLHVFTRPSELRAMRWDDIDGDLYRIPAERMKRDKPHVVPLSPQVQAMLQEVRSKPWAHPEYVFPGQRGRKYISIAALGAALRKRSIDYWQPHGSRATASTLLRELGHDGDLIELQLAHTRGNSVRASYDHSEKLDARRKMMAAWSDYIEAQIYGRNVVAIGGAVA